MELESKRLKLQEVTWADLEDIHHLYSYSEVDEYNTLGIPGDIEETREIIRPAVKSRDAETRKSYLWKIVKKDSGEFIGSAGMSLSANRFRLGEISYEFLPSHWGN